MVTHNKFIRLAWALALLAGVGTGTPTYAASATRTSSFEYDATSGLPTKEVIEPDNPNLCLVTTYTYDAFGNKTGATTRNCNGGSGEAATPTGDAVIVSRTSSTTFDSQGRFATGSSNALSQSETRVFNANFGGVTSLTGPNSLTTTGSYDSFGRKTLETRADGTKTQLDYLFCSGVNGGTHACPTYGKYLVQTTPKDAAGSANGAITKVYYDALSREIRSETQGFDGTLVYKDTQYNALGRVTQVSKPYYAGQTVYWTTFAYDVLGRVTTETQPTTTPGTIRTATTYNGLTITATVSNNGAGTNLPEGVTQSKTMTKNSQGQTVTITDTQANTLTYTYDPFGNVLTTNAGGITTTLTYDLRGRKLTMADPDMGSWTYAYDALGQLKRQTNAKAQITTMTYDKLGRMTNRTEPDLISNWTYDTCTKGVGKLCQATSNNGYVRTHSYDSLGRPSSTVTTVDTTYTITYGYDTNGRPASTTYPTGFIAKNVYNARGYLQKVTDNAGTLVYWQAMTVSATGKVLTENLGNGLSTVRGYDVLDRMTSNVVEPTGGGTDVQSFTYTYDTIGNVTQRVDVFQSNLTENFTYDKLNRLLQSSGTGLTTRSYSYSVTGNITYRSGAGTYNYNAQGTPCAGGTGGGPHAVCSVTGTVNGYTNPTFTYDANGSLLTGLGRTLTYMSFNMPNTVVAPNNLVPGTNTTYTYVYNAEHERTKHIVQRTDGTFTTIYLHPAGKGELLYEKEIKPTVTEHKHYITAGAIQIGVYLTRSDATTEMRYFHSDHLGSLTLITNASGAVLERLAFEAFGKRRYASGTDDPTNGLYGIKTDRGFTNHEHLDEIALIHMNGRIYDPVLSRFMSPDPFIQSPDNLQSYNRYTYGFNNPLSGIDPTGYGWLRNFFRNPVRTIVRTVEKIVHNPQLIVGIAVAYFTYGAATSLMSAYTAAAGGASAFGVSTVAATGTIGSLGFAAGTVGLATAGAAGGFTFGLVASGGDLSVALRSAVAGGIGGAITGFYGDTWNLQRVAAQSVAGGVTSKLQGGNFKDGFLTAVVTSGTRYLYNSMVGYDVTAAPGENRPGDDARRQTYRPNEDGRLALNDQRMNIVGLNQEFNGSILDSIKQGGALSRALNMVPGINAVGGLDDYWQNHLTNYYLLPLTIPGSVFVTAPALLDRIPLYRPQDPFNRRGNRKE